jgi:hypothetical protein
VGEKLRKNPGRFGLGDVVGEKNCAEPFWGRKTVLPASWRVGPTGRRRQQARCARLLARSCARAQRTRLGRGVLGVLAIGSSADGRGARVELARPGWRRGGAGWRAAGLARTRAHEERVGAGGPRGRKRGREERGWAGRDGPGKGAGLKFISPFSFLFLSLFYLFRFDIMRKQMIR